LSWCSHLPTVDFIIQPRNVAAAKDELTQKIRRLIVRWHIEGGRRVASPGKTLDRIVIRRAFFLPRESLQLNAGHPNNASNHKSPMKFQRSTLTPYRVALRTLFFTITSGLLFVSVSAQERDYREARVYVTAPPVSTPATITAFPAPSPVPAQLLTDRGFFALAPLEEPDEDIPTIIIDDKKTFQTVVGFGGAFTDAAASVFARLIHPGAKRIVCTSTSDDFIATAALNPDGKIAVVVFNLKDHETFMRVWLRGQFVKYQCPPNATITFILQPV
jgi:Glycosyl hydrolase family 30 beta sandwich domain